MHLLKSIRALSVGLLVAGSTIAGGVGLATATAQDSSTTAAADSHIAFIHKGTCGNLDPASQQSLTNVEPRKDDDDSDKTPEPQGVLTSPTVIYSFTDVDMKLDDLLSEAHAIAVHLSADQPGVTIACGDLGGVVVNDDLLIGLAPQDNSGYYGIAKLHKDGDKTEVEIFLVVPTGEPSDATPVA
ncbi:MAG TPA: hypothetical protein VNP95_13700 [Thermomicrobiales bacterium]|nr:hypothetical protein [Thermomicrobiales bacterium]